MRLSPIDTTDPPYPVGTVVRLRAVSAWAGHDPGARPIACQYVEDGGGVRVVYWSAELDKHVGRAFVVVAGPPGGLPVVRPADRPDCDGGWSLHPDWLEATVPDDPAGPPCLCDLHAVVMVVGCKCGRMQRERAARAVA